MADPIPFRRKPPKLELIEGDLVDTELQINGPAMCTACKHVWTAVAPAGTFEFECPSCGTMRGILSGHVTPGKEPMFVHTCGCWAFAIGKVMGTVCIGCGEAVDWNKVT